MKKWLIIFAVSVLAIAGLVAGFYIHAISNVGDEKKAAFEKAKSESGLVSLTDFFIYNGMESYYIVIGDDAEETKKIVWIPNGKSDEKEIITENYSAGKTKEDIAKMVEKQLNPAEIISIKLGMEKGTPLWEVTYLDAGNRYNYDYYDFKTGEWLKYYRSI